MSFSKRTALKDAAGIMKTIITNGAAVAFNCLITMLIIPFVAESLGTESYGFVSLANNFVSFAAILSLALNSYAVRYVSVAYHKGENEKAGSYYSTVMIGNVVFSVGVIALGAVFSCYADKALNVPEDLRRDVKILFILMFINLGIQTVGGSLTVFAYINNRMDIIGVSRFLAYVSELAVFVILFKVLSPKMWYVSAAYLMYSTALFFLYFFMLKKYFVQIPFSMKHFKIKSMCELAGNGLWNSVNSLGNVLNSELDLLITNMMLDTLVMGELAIAKTMGALIPIIYSLVSQAFQPRLLKHYSEQNNPGLVHELKNAMHISGFFVGLFFCLIVAVGEEFYQLWVPGQNARMLYILTILTMLSYLLEGVVGPLYYVYTITVKNKIPCMVTLAGGIMNVLAMYLLLKHTSLGVYAVTGTTIVVTMFINLVTNPLYIAKCLNVKWNTFYSTIAFYIIFVISTSFLLKWISGMFDISNWGVFLFVLALEMPAGAGVYVAASKLQAFKQQ